MAFLLLVPTICPTSCVTFAQDTATKPSQTPAPTNIETAQPATEHSSPESTEPATATKSDAEKEKEKTVLIMMASLAAILAVGVFGIAVIMVWARRLRRIARDLPAQRTIGNDFWFLKPPKPTVSESNVLEGHRPIHPPQTEEPSE